MSANTGLDVSFAHVIAEWPHDRPLHACRIDPAGRFVICGSEDALVERYKLSDGSRTLLNGGHDTWVQAIAFAKDGSQVASGGCDGKITWWDPAAETPSPRRSIDAHVGWVRSLAVSPDSALLASSGNDNRVRLWNVADGNLVREMIGHERHVYSTSFHHQGKYLLTGDLMGVLKQWDVATGKEVRTFDASPLHCYVEEQRSDFGGVRAIAASPDGKWLAAGGTFNASNPMGAVHEPVVLLFNWDTGKVEKQLVAEGIKQGLVCRLTWLGDGTTLMGLCSGVSGGFLLFWRTTAEKDFFRFKLPHLARDMDVHPDGLQVATAHFDRRVRITRLAAKVDNNA